MHACALIEPEACSVIIWTHDELVFRRQYVDISSDSPSSVRVTMSTAKFIFTSYSTFQTTQCASITAVYRPTNTPVLSAWRESAAATNLPGLLARYKQCIALIAPRGAGLQLSAL